MRSDLPLRSYRRAAFAAIVFLVAVSAATSAGAQSFFDDLFGGSKLPFSKPGGYGAQQRMLRATGINDGRPYMARPLLSPQRYQDPTDHALGAAMFKTVCVRMCDGFYWPVSFAVTRQRFYREGGVCQSSCGSEAKLFYVPSDNGRIEDAQDLTGRVYSRLPNAFRYRKSLVQGCTCRPEPWSQAEIDRHRTYAMRGDAPKLEPDASAKVAAPEVNIQNASAMTGDRLAVAPTMEPPWSADHTLKSSPAAPRYRSPSAQSQPRPHSVIVPLGNARAPFWNDGFGGSAKYTRRGDAPGRVR